MIDEFLARLLYRAGMASCILRICASASKYGQIETAHRTYPHISGNLHVNSR
jgi:hypothetical protein